MKSLNVLWIIAKQTNKQTNLAMAEEDTVRFLAIISSNSTSLIVAPGGGYPGGTPAGGKNAGLTWAPPGRAGAAVWGGGNRPGTCLKNEK